MGLTVELANTPRIEPGTHAGLQETHGPIHDRDRLLSDARSIRTADQLPLLNSYSEISGLGALSTREKNQISACILEIKNSSLLPPQIRNEIISSLVEDLTHPEMINQGVMATCVPTSLQFKLASTEPLQYAAMIRDLAVKGEFTFSDPQKTTLRLSDSSLRADEKHVLPPFEERQVTERIVQDLFMRYAVGDTITYDNHTDTSHGVYQGQEVTFKGLCRDHIERLINGVTGAKHETITNDGSVHPSEIIKLIQEQLRENQRPQIDLRYAKSGDHQMHNFDVLKIEGDRVVLYNPWGAMNPPPKSGAIQEMSLTDFTSQLSCVFVKTDKTNDGFTTSIPVIAQNIPNPILPLPPANPEGLIEFHITPQFGAELNRVTPSLSVVPLEQAKPNNAQETPVTEQRVVASPDGAAFAAASARMNAGERDSARRLARAMSKPSRQTSSDDEPDV